jgi:peptide/histidine transporter 3/4
VVLLLLHSGFECLESTAFNGISTNLVMYLETVLHGSNVASASNVTMWFGTSYLIPVFGAIIADAFWGNYNTILVSLAIYLVVCTRPASSFSSPSSRIRR